MTRAQLRALQLIAGAQPVSDSWLRGHGVRSATVDVLVREGLVAAESRRLNQPPFASYRIYRIPAGEQL